MAALIAMLDERLRAGSEAVEDDVSRSALECAATSGGRIDFKKML